MKDDVRRLWAATRVLVWSEPLSLVSLPRAALARAAELVAGAGGGFAALVVERDEVSLTLAASAWAAVESVEATAVDGPYRALTLDLPIDLGVSGYLLPAAERLAEAGVAIVPQCAYLKDHLLVREADAARAAEIVSALAAECAAELSGPGRTE